MPEYTPTTQWEDALLDQLAEAAAPVVYQILRDRGELPPSARDWSNMEAPFRAAWVADVRDIMPPVLDAILISDWLAAHDREVAARTLEAASDDYYGDTHIPGLSALTWLRERAAAVRSGTEGSTDV